MMIIEDAIDLDDEEEEDDDDDLQLAADDTRLRYQQLQARGRAAELAFNRRLEREREEAEANAAAAAAVVAAKSRAHSRSKSRSRPGTPILGSLFKRDNFTIGITRSQSPPISSVEKEKSQRRPSVTNLFKLKPLSRSSSSKSIYNNPASTSSSSQSSQATSPFPSPLTPLSPLPFFLSPKTRRKAIPNAGEDVVESGPLASFGSPLARAPRRPSPTRAMTLPENNLLGLQRNGGVIPHRRYRDPSPLRSNSNSEHDPAATPHLTYAD